MNTFTPVIAVAVTVLGFASHTSVAESPVPLPQPVPVEIVKEISFKDRLIEATLEERRIMVKEKVMALAKVHGVNGEQVYGTIAKCENTGLDTTLQSLHRYTYSNPRWGTVVGERERSYGLAQIHLPSHPSITYEQATDPAWALEWMVKEFASGNQTAWSCWKKLYGVQ